MTTAPGTLGLRPAEEVRRYSVVKVNAWPAEGDKQHQNTHTTSSCKEEGWVSADKEKRNQTTCKKLTNVVSWAFIKGCGLDLLEQCVRPAMVIKQEPHFGSVAIYYNTHLKQAEKNQKYCLQKSLKTTMSAGLLSCQHCIFHCRVLRVLRAVLVSPGVQLHRVTVLHFWGVHGWVLQG